MTGGNIAAGESETKTAIARCFPLGKVTIPMSFVAAVLPPNVPLEPITSLVVYRIGALRFVSSASWCSGTSVVAIVMFGAPTRPPVALP